MPGTRTFLRRHWPILLLAGITSVLLFTHLGRDYLWEDEGDTAVLARNILQHGLPMAWDGRTFVAPDYGQRLTSGFVMVSHPWLQYYTVAASFAIFGDSIWAARFPFALAGLATILLVYAIVLFAAGSRRAAVSASVLLAANVQFLLFSRQARNYSLHAFLTCLLVWQLLHLRTRRAAALFALTGILLFHTHPIGLAAVVALALLTMVYEPLYGSRRAVHAAAVVVCYAVPWMIASQAGYARNTSLLADAALFFPRAMQFGAEWISVAPLAGLIALYLAARFAARHRAPAPRRQDRKPAPVFAPAERNLVAACCGIAVLEALVVAVTQSRADLWIIGLHHTPELIPLTLIPAGMLVSKVSRSSRAGWAALMLVFCFTRAGRAAAVTLFMDPQPKLAADRLVTFHVPASFASRLLRTEELHYVRSLGAPNPGTIARVSDFLRSHAAPTDVVITNYSWEPLYFHTQLPQAAKVAPSFPIYWAARAAGLPEYVFDGSRATWIVWRRAWPALFHEQNISDVIRRVRESGMVPRLVASIPETIYENRANVHFHRFSGGHYVFSPYPNAPDVLIFHVETAEDAVVHYRQDLAARPDDVGLLTDAAVALDATGHLDEAVSLLEHALRVAPASENVERALASALFDSRDAAGAERHARRAVALAPDDPLAHDVLGMSLAVQSKFEESRAELAQALALAPSDASVRRQLAQVDAFMRR